MKDIGYSVMEHRVLLCGADRQKGNLEMSYSKTAMLALVVHCIVNYNALMNRHFHHSTASGKAYRHLMVSVLVFYITDLMWGILYDAHMITAVTVDTTVFFAAMTATVLTWTRYVISYLQQETFFTRALHCCGKVFVLGIALILGANLFLPVMFWFDKEGVYHAGPVRYVMLAVQILMFFSTAMYVLMTARTRGSRYWRRHLAIGFFGMTMSLMVTLQVLYPVEPMYSIGCLVGVCVLHTFVLEDLKEDRRLELERLFQREKEYRKELGSAMELAYKDSLTGVRNTHAYREAERQVDSRLTRGELQEFAVAVFDVNSLKQTNDTLGHEAGDELIQNACHQICRVFAHSPVFRIGGDEFVALLEGEDFRNREALMAEFERIAEENRHSGGPVVASGLAEYEPGYDNSYSRVFERADVHMYERKNRLKTMFP